MGKQIIDEVVKILKSFGAKEIILFGSYARGDNNPDSDIDVIVEFNEIKGLFEKARIIRTVEEKTGLKIDILSKDFINPYLKPYIERDMITIFQS